MKRILFPLLAAAAAANLQGAVTELNVADGTIESSDGQFVGRDFSIARDFKMELLYNVPAAEGQWVALAFDSKGRLVTTGHATDVMNRVTIPAVGRPGDVQVERLTSAQVGASEGLLEAFGGMYMNVNRSNTMRHGIYKLTDTNNDDKYDKTEIIRFLNASGDHGTHQLRLHENRIYVMNGNSTRATVFDRSRVPAHWAEDVLTVRIPTGFMGSSFGDHTLEAYVFSFDRDGKDFELFSRGGRNPVSMDFNRDGELFTYDSDMEWDMGVPWYRPTNLQHVVSGADFGFRNGARVHPQWQFDYVPYVAAMGSGSPVGGSFAVGAKFPARYQDAYYAADWSYGYLYSTFLTPKGASYEGDPQTFISGRPFPVTGSLVNPADGSLLVITGGRAQTQLYRITYTGGESTAPAPSDAAAAAARAVRKGLERFHGRADNAALAALWPHLSNHDRAIRYAARTALEWQPVAQWRDRALSETDPRKSIAAIASLARVSGKDDYARTATTPAPDKALQARMIASLDRIDFASLPFQDKLDLLRAYSLTFIRLGRPDEATRLRQIAKFDPHFPATQREMNWELADMLAYLNAPSAPAKIVGLIRDGAGGPRYGMVEWNNPQLRQRQDQGGLNNATNRGRSQQSLQKQEDQIYLAQMLRVVTNGWTPELRQEYLKWFPAALAEYRGGNQFVASIQNIRADAISQIPEAERAGLADLLAPIAAPAGRGGAGAGGGGGGAAGGRGGQ